MHPVRLRINNAVTFLEEKNVRCDFRPRICFKCCIWQSYCSKKICSLGIILTDRFVFFIHRPFTCNNCNYTTGTYFINRFGNKIIVNQKILLIVSLICNFVLSKRDISNRHIKEVVRILCLFKTGNSNAGIRVQLFRNSTADIIQLHTIQTTFSHSFRQHTKEIADTHRRLQNISFGKSHVFQCFVNASNNRRTCIMCI